VVIDCTEGAASATLASNVRFTTARFTLIMMAHPLLPPNSHRRRASA
jgi:hypothetical protein